MKRPPFIKNPAIQYFLSQAGSRLIIAASSFVFLLISILHWENVNGEVRELQYRLKTIQQYSLRSQKAESLMREYPLLFQAFKACHFEHPYTPQSLRDVLPYTAVFGSPHSDHGFITQEISFTIPCLFDHDIFSFIDQLLTQGPGLFTVHEISLIKLHAVTDEVLGKIAKGDPITLFEGRVQTTWIHR